MSLDQHAIVITANDEDDINSLSKSVVYQKPFTATSVFEVSLTSYPMQPWTNKNVDLTQWFNYGLNPSTWSKYCIDQLAKSTAFQQSNVTKNN